MMAFCQAALPWVAMGIALAAAAKLMNAEAKDESSEEK